jgi:hypothetical protein
VAWEPIIRLVCVGVPPLGSAAWGFPEPAVGWASWPILGQIRKTTVLYKNLVRAKRCLPV